MILSDINLLLYAHDADSDHFEAAKSWLEETLSSSTLFLTWHVVMGFVRIVTSPRSYPNPYKPAEAMLHAKNLLDHRNSQILHPGANHFEIFQRLVKEAKISGPRLMDAHLAAVAIEHGVSFASNDRDFRLFDDLNLVNPLALKK